MTMQGVRKHWATRAWPGVSAAFVIFVGSIAAVKLGKTIMPSPASTFRTANLIVDDQTNVKDVTTTGTFKNTTNGFFYQPAGSNELDFMYESAGTNLGYINFSSFHNTTSAFRDLCISNGKGAFGDNCLLYAYGTSSRIGILNASPQTALDVTGMIQSTLGFNTEAGMIEAGLGGVFPKVTIDPAHSQAVFSLTNVGFGNQPTPLSPVDIIGAGFNLTTEQPLALQAFITAGQATYDTTAQPRRAYGMFYDGSQSISAGTNILTGIGLRLDENMGGHATPGSLVHPVGLWVDEGELWINEHIMYTTRPVHLSPISVSSCGTGMPTVAGNDSGGRITVGGGAVVSCTLAFQIEFTDHTNTAIIPSCLVEAENGQVVQISPTSQQLVMTGTLTGTFLNYRCGGADNALPGP
jgi:hypothetical protein